MDLPNSAVPSHTIDRLRSAFLGTAILFVLAADTGALASQHPIDPVLLVVPLPADPNADSAYVVELATHLRNRMTDKRSRLYSVADHCRLAGFCDELLSDSSSHRFAERLGAYQYVVGSFSRDSNVPRLHLRVMDTGMRGGIHHLASSLTVQANSDMQPRDFAQLIDEALSDTLENVVRAARNARSCWTSVGEDNLAEARDFANAAYRLIPNHPSAAMCLSMVFEMARRPDSVVLALEQAVAGDSMLSRAWRRLAREYLNRGDTAGAVSAHMNEVRGEPDNVERRTRVVRLMEVLGRFENAVTLLREAARDTPGNSEARLLLTQKCMSYEMWQCALDASAERYALDSSLTGDTLFYYQTIGLAQTLHDTVALISWTDEAVNSIRQGAADAWDRVEQARRTAEQIDRALNSFRMVRGDALRDVGQMESALETYRTIWESNPEHALSRVAAARLSLHGRFLTADPVSRQDSVSLRAADSLLTETARRSEDTQVSYAVAQSYFDVGVRLVQHRLDPATAVLWLDKAIGETTDSTIQRRAHGYSALALLYLVEDLDATIRAERTCEPVQQQERLLRRATGAVEMAGDEFPRMIEQINSSIGAFYELLPEIRRALGCSRS